MVSATIGDQEIQSTEQIESSGPTSTQRLRDELRREFEDLAEYAGTQEIVVVDDRSILRYLDRDELPIFVPSSMRNKVL